jgi:large subunit ribosomal protein L18
MALTKIQKRERIKRRIKSNLITSADRPRLSVFRSNKEIYAQIIDDEKNVTLASASSYVKGTDKINKVDQAKQVGAVIAKKAKEAGIETVVFDRNGYVYHGRIKALAESARENGLKF